MSGFNQAWARYQCRRKGHRYVLVNGYERCSRCAQAGRVWKIRAGEWTSNSEPHPCPRILGDEPSP